MTINDYISIYQNFKNQYNGKYIDIDGMYGAQCWDLGQMFFSRFLGIPESVLGGVGVVNGMLYGEKRAQLNQYFEEYDSNKIAAIPGDVAIWEYGHLALVDNWNGGSILYFSQNPNPCQVMKITTGGLHLFRRKGLSVPKPAITPTVKRNTNVDQLQVNNPTLNVRVNTGIQYESLGFAPKGIYNYYESENVNGYVWYRIADNQWLAYDPSWITLMPKSEPQPDENPGGSSGNGNQTDQDPPVKVSGCAKFWGNSSKSMAKLFSWRK